MHGYLNTGYWKFFVEEHSNFSKWQSNNATVDLSLDAHMRGDAVAVYVQASGM